MAIRIDNFLNGFPALSPRSMDIEMRMFSAQELPAPPESLTERVEDIFNNIISIRQLEKLASPLVTKIDFSNNPHVNLWWIGKLKCLAPNLEEIDLRGCQGIEDEVSTGIALNRLEKLKVVKLHGSSLSPKATGSLWNRSEGRPTVRIEHDWRDNKSILGHVIRRAKDVHQPNEFYWAALENLTQNGSWCDEEMIMLFTAYGKDMDPRMQAWRNLVLGMTEILKPEVYSTLQALHQQA